MLYSTQADSSFCSLRTSVGSSLLWEQRRPQYDRGKPGAEYEAYTPGLSDTALSPYQSRHFEVMSTYPPTQERRLRPAYELSADEISMFAYEESSRTGDNLDGSYNIDPALLTRPTSSVGTREASTASAPGLPSAPPAMATSQSAIHTLPSAEDQAQEASSRAATSIDSYDLIDNLLNNIAPRTSAMRELMQDSGDATAPAGKDANIAEFKRFLWDLTKQQSASQIDQDSLSSAASSRFQSSTASSASRQGPASQPASSNGRPGANMRSVRNAVAPASLPPTRVAPMTSLPSKTRGRTASSPTQPAVPVVGTIHPTARVTFTSSPIRPSPLRQGEPSGSSAQVDLTAFARAPIDPQLMSTSVTQTMSQLPESNTAMSDHSDSPQYSPAPSSTTSEYLPSPSKTVLAKSTGSAKSTTRRPKTKHKSERRIKRAYFPNYPPSSVSLPANISLHQICQRYPNHLYGDTLGRFSAAGWSARQIWEACRLDGRNDGAAMRQWNYLEHRILRIGRENEDPDEETPVEGTKRRREILQPNDEEEEAEYPSQASERAKSEESLEGLEEADARTTSMDASALSGLEHGRGQMYRSSDSSTSGGYKQAWQLSAARPHIEPQQTATRNGEAAMGPSQRSLPPAAMEVWQSPMPIVDPRVGPAIDAFKVGIWLESIRQQQLLQQLHPAVKAAPADQQPALAQNLWRARYNRWEDSIRQRCGFQLERVPGANPMPLLNAIYLRDMGDCSRMRIDDFQEKKLAVMNATMQGIFRHVSQFRAEIMSLSGSRSSQDAGQALGQLSLPAAAAAAVADTSARLMTVEAEREATSTAVISNQITTVAVEETTIAKADGSIVKALGPVYDGPSADETKQYLGSETTASQIDVENGQETDIRGAARNDDRTTIMTRPTSSMHDGTTGEKFNHAADVGILQIHGEQ